tara:strand:+ start:5516 stop:5788 length:273 start_codon:yes stop_codon:yes gene_type:complete
MVTGVIMTYEKPDMLSDDNKESLKFLYRHVKKLVVSSDNDTLLSAIDYMIARAESEGNEHISHRDKLVMRRELLTAIYKLFDESYWRIKQ